MTPADLDGFVVFDRRQSGRKGTGMPYVRIDSKGNLLIFNAAASRLIADVTHFRLLYDRATRRIGLEATSADDLNGYSVGKVNGGRNVSARGFARHFDLPLGERWPLTQEGSLWIAQLPPMAP